MDFVVNGLRKELGMTYSPGGLSSRVEHFTPPSSQLSTPTPPHTASYHPYININAHHTYDTKFDRLYFDADNNLIDRETLETPPLSYKNASSNKPQPIPRNPSQISAVKDYNAIQQYNPYFYGNFYQLPQSINYRRITVSNATSSLLLIAFNENTTGVLLGTPAPNLDTAPPPGTRSLYLRGGESRDLAVNSIGERQQFLHVFDGESSQHYACAHSYGLRTDCNLFVIRDSHTSMFPGVHALGKPEDAVAISRKFIYGFRTSRFARAS